MPFRTPLESDLDRVRTLFLQMCVRAEAMVRQAVRSVVERDPQLGRTVIAADRELDKLEMEIDQLCLKVLALRQPVGQKLRMVTTSMKMVTDLERIGDLAVNIAERGIELSSSPGFEVGFELNAMGQQVADMLRDAADAFVDADPTIARRLRELDRGVDRLNRETFARGVKIMESHPDQATRVLSVTSISRYLERVGDHVVNIGEMVVFLVDGEDVRHPKRHTKT